MLWISDEWKDYEVLDTSDGERLERWGRYILVFQITWGSGRTRIYLPQRSRRSPSEVSRTS